MNPCWPPQKKGADNPRSLFSPEQAERLRDRYAHGDCTIKQLQRETGAGYQTIRRVVKGERYCEEP